MNPIEILLDEHKLVNRVFFIVENIRDKLTKKDDVPASTFWKLIDFIRGYADIIHHSKEEDILFDYMREKDTAISDVVQQNIAVLIEEHIEALDIANEMHKAVRLYQSGKSKARGNVLKAVNKYLKIMKPHFAMEEDEVFPAMLGVLNQEERDKLKAEFDRFDEILGGKEVHSRFTKMVEELEQETGAL